VIISSQRPLPDNAQHLQQANIHALGGIQTHNLSRRAAADLRRRPRGYWDRRSNHIQNKLGVTVKHLIFRWQTRMILAEALNFCLSPSVNIPSYSKRQATEVKLKRGVTVHLHMQSCTILP
jgi:hypothetical protein